jgi:hypothetical protein
MDGTVRVRTVVNFAVAVFAGLLVALVVLWAMRADAAPGDADTTFVSLTPCRLADTRPANQVGPNTTFGSGATKVFQATGSNGKCVIPADAVGLSLNVTAVGATSRTFVTVWGDGDLPLASALNPAPGQPPVPNAVTTPLSGTGAFRVYNDQGSLNLIIDINGYYTKGSLQGLNARLSALETTGIPQAVLDQLDALEADVTALESANTALEAKVSALESANTSQQADIDALKAKTASMSVLTDNGQPTVRFTGVNLQVVSGSGSTAGAVNGRGNLIVGYNENNGDTKTGSHNLIVGPQHTYTGYSGLVAGINNTISGNYASVSGGGSNTASGNSASVSGGSLNTASGNSASVSGGGGNTASSLSASVSGGFDNTASGLYASVSGGNVRVATGEDDWAAGGLFQDF